MADNKDLRRKLEQVHDEIANIDHVDDKGRAILRDVDGHVQDLLEQPAKDTPEPKPAMRPGLETAIRHFEVTHPSLTAALSDLLTALSNAGI